MEVLFLHLSDSHFSSKETIDIISIEKIVDSLKVLIPFNKCCIIYSGDLTYSSSNSEVDMVMSFIKKLSRDIKSKYRLKNWVEVCVVPGNHDLNYSLISRERKDTALIKSAFLEKDKQHKIEQIYFDDLRGFDNFSKLQKYFNSYCQRDEIVNHRVFDYNNFNFNVCMVNTAPLSLCVETNEDKLYHHLTSKNLQDIIPKNKAEIHMIVIHHPIEWFHYEVKEELQKIINKYYDVVFIGHEHSYRSEVKNINNENHIVYLFADALLCGDKPIGYSIAKFNIISRRFVEHKFKWNGQRGFFEQSNDRDVDTHLKGDRNLSTNFNISQKYQRSLDKEPTENLKVDIYRYFVFPLISYFPSSDVNQEKCLNNIDELIELLNTQRKIIIQGNNNSGKTTLCNILCKKITKSKVPVLIRGENISKGAKIDSVIKQSFMEMYGDDMSLYHEFEQLDRDKKVIIVDNANIWSNTSKEKVMTYFSEYYDFVIVFSDRDWNLNVVEQTINALREDKFIKLTIEPLYFDKREQLIKNVLMILEGTVNSKDVEYINEYIHNQVKHCPREPEFIIQLIKYYKDCGGAFIDDRQNVFSVVFENDLYNKIRENSKSIDMIEIFTAFEELAYYMHFHKMYPMKYSDMINIIDNYNKKYDEEVRAKKVHDTAVQSHIFKEIDDINTFIFKEKRVFAYFVARSLVKKKHESTIEVDLNKVLNNMCFGINGDIMLFLAYITREVNILTSILECAKKSTKDWIEFSFDDKVGNLEYLKYVSNKEKIMLPSVSEKEKIKKDKKNIEKSTMKNEDSSVPEIYNYDENESDLEFNQLIKSIKMLELISKMLPNFTGTFISAEFKKECIDLIYNYPNKIIFKLFNDINDNFLDNVQKIKEEIPELAENLGGDVDSIAKELATQSVMFIMNIYYFTAKLCTNNKTLRVLDKYNSETLTHKIQNTLMHISAGSFDEFYAKIMNIKKKSDIKVVNFITTLIARQYILSNDIELHGSGQKLLDTFFSNNTKRIQMDIYKSRVIKKD